MDNFLTGQLKSHFWHASRDNLQKWLGKGGGVGVFCMDKLKWGEGCCIVTQTHTHIHTHMKWAVWEIVVVCGAGRSN